MNLHGKIIFIVDTIYQFAISPRFVFSMSLKLKDTSSEAALSDAKSPMSVDLLLEVWLNGNEAVVTGRGEMRGREKGINVSDMTTQNKKACKYSQFPPTATLRNSLSPPSAATGAASPGGPLRPPTPWSGKEIPAVAPLLPLKNAAADA